MIILLVIVVVYKAEKKKKKKCVSLGQGIGKKASKMCVYFKKASVCLSSIKIKERLYPSVPSLWSPINRPESLPISRPESLPCEWFFRTPLGPLHRTL